MDCAQARKLMDAYVDCETDAVTAFAMEEHVARCTGCRDEARRVEELRSLLRGAAPYYAASPALVDTIRRQAGLAAARTRRPGFRWWLSFLRPAALVAVVALVTWFATSRYGVGRSEDIAAQVIAGHNRATLTTHLADVASSERHTVKPWLSSKLDFSPPVADLAQIGYPLVGGRLDFVQHRSVAVLVYKRREHVIDLFVWPDRDALAAAPRAMGSQAGFQVVHWSSGEMTYWAVSDLNGPELKTFAEAFQAQTAPAGNTTR